MKFILFRITFIFCLVVAPLPFVWLLHASDINISAPTIIPRVEISPALTSGSFIEGALFDIPIVINTRGQSINTIKLNLRFDSDKMSVVDASGGTSIINMWVETPKFNNKTGTERMSGIITNGITTNEGVIVKITFRALKTGIANLTIDEDSLVLLNNGFGSEAKIEAGRGQYRILSSPPGGVNVYSYTHQIRDKWYNNNSPVFDWEMDPEVTGFSFILDDKPNTIPPNNVISSSTTYGYQDIGDGVWYFHIKAQKKASWGETTHYQVRIDTQPPAKFNPQVNYLVSENSPKAIVSFDTTDRLSGIDRYEVSAIDISQTEEEVSTFIESKSPYVLSLDKNEGTRLIIRAFDGAGNASDNHITITAPFSILSFFTNSLDILIGVLVLVLASMVLIHYVLTHRILAGFKKENQNIIN